jgi:predicted N-acyltransferase
MQCKTITSITTISNTEWKKVSNGQNPFLRQEFLKALEEHEAVGERSGWIINHVACIDDAGALLGFVPLYTKHNSYGELVFDWNWADAYHRAGLPYYPKLVSALPYTPVTSPRLLIANSNNAESIRRALVTYVKEFAIAQNVSSLHWLFPDANDLDFLREQDYLTRIDCQFHWHNKDYDSFEHFLGGFTAKKRKNVHRERRLVTENNFEFETLHGYDIDDRRWQLLYPFYRDTFLKKGGIPTLSLGFFQQVSREMGEQLIVFAAKRHGEYVAAAICFKSDTTLFGRHWGCREHFDSLHFELCFYRGIEYAIAHNLSRFEPGAQGEHKISRGFVPTPVYSAHWIAHPQFAVAISRYLQQEKQLMTEQIQSLAEQTPYREG